MSKPDIRLKRAYEPPAAADGLRILVERLWPRGLARARAKIAIYTLVFDDLAPLARR